MRGRRGLLAAALLLLLLPRILLSAAAQRTGLEGKTVSILGDSISTYAGVSNNAGRNRTIGKGPVFYTPGMLGVYQKDTWWQQAADELGMRILVNNSWSGSCMYMTGAGTPGAYLDRCVQLHTGKGAKPDIIAVFLGTNDRDYFADSMGTFAAIDFETLIVPGEKGFTYAEPKTCMEAYAITLHKMRQRYPDAEIYCFSLLQRPGFPQMSIFSFQGELTRLAEHYGVYVVDLLRCGVFGRQSAYDLLMGDYVHPNAAGMAAIRGAFTDSLLRNSRYVSPELELCSAAYALENVAVLQGTAHTLIRGEPFRIDLAVLEEGAALNVTVTMAGKDITAEVRQGSSIVIGEVTGDLHIAACARTPA